MRGMAIIGGKQDMMTFSLEGKYLKGILMMLTITPVSWTMTMVEVMTMRARGKKNPRVKRKML